MPLFLTPNDFTHEGESAATQWVKQRTWLIEGVHTFQIDVVYFYWLKCVNRYILFHVVTCRQDGINIDTGEGRRQSSSVCESTRTESGTKFS